MFDLNVLPMNLNNGRNLGELPGLQVFPASRRAEKSRQNDVLILLITVEKKPVSVREYEEWGKIFSEAYFSARGSFTMGITAAVKKISKFLEQSFPGNLLPNIFLNIAVLRGRTLMIGHVGPVNTTIVFSDHVDNFNDESFPGLGKTGQVVRFFQSDIHSGDLILMCPRAPQGWTNEAILDATSESPLNVIRYLLDQARGNLQGAVVQIKAGTGEILYRYKPPITANIALGYENIPADDSAVPVPKSKVPVSSEGRYGSAADSAQTAENTGLLLGNDAESERPVYRLRVPFDPFPSDEQEAPQPLRSAAKEIPEIPDPPVSLPDADMLNSDETGSEPPAAPFDAVAESATDLSGSNAETNDEKEPDPIERTRDSVNPVPSGGKGNLSPGKGTIKKILMVLVLCIVIPVLIAVTLSRFYSARGKNQFYRESLENAVSTAKIAVEQTEPELERISWEKVLEYLDEADAFGTSKAASDLRNQAYDVLDSLENGRKTIYHYALADQLPKTANLTAVESTSQYIYALDENSGSILRLFVYNTGLTLDRNFQCGPGSYAEFGSAASNDSIPVTVGKLVDFVLIPQGISGSTALAAVDQDANLLYCIPDGENKAVRLSTPSIGWLGIDGLYYASGTLYVLDSRNEAIWRFEYQGESGFSGEPKSYFGAGAPGMKDVTDFVIYDRYSYLLRKNGTLIFCDYTGYDPACSHISTLENENNESIDLTDRAFFQIKLNTSPDISLYLMDRNLQSVVNASLKLNLVRYIVPDRAASDGVGKPVSGFGFVNNANLLWASEAELYNGAMP